MINPPVPKLTPADINKMILLNSASQPVMQLFHKPFLFEPSKLKVGETGFVAAQTDPLQQYPYEAKKPRIDTYQFRHRLSSYIINGFELSESNNKLVVAPGKMNVFLPAKPSVAESYIEVTYSGATIDLSIFGNNPYNFPLPVVAYITTNGQNTLSLEVKVGVPVIEEHNHNKEYVTLGSVFVSPSDLISVVDSSSRWKGTSEKLEDLVMATTPMQHNIIPVLDSQLGIKVLLGDHAAIYDRSVTPVDVNFLQTQFTPASQVRFTVLDSNGGYIKQAVGSAVECVVAGKLQDTLRNGSPTAMQTGQFALHPLFYSAGTDSLGAPTNGILYMQIAQTVYDKPIGSQGLFFVEEWMLEKSLGNFLRCDLIQNTAAFIGFFVCGEGVSTLSECEILIASDFFSNSFKDPDPALPKEGVIEDAYVTYHDGAYHADGMTAPQVPGMGLIKGGEKIEPFLDFGDNYRSFKLVCKYGYDDPTVKYPHLGELILYNKYYPDGISSMGSGADAAMLKLLVGKAFLYAENMIEGVVPLNGGSWDDLKNSLAREELEQDCLTLKYLSLYTGGNLASVCWGRLGDTTKDPAVDTDFAEVDKRIMPVYFNFGLSVEGEPFIGAASQNSASQYEMGLPNIPNNASINYSFLRDSSFRTILSTKTANSFNTPASDGSDRQGSTKVNYVATMGEHSGTFLMDMFVKGRRAGATEPSVFPDQSPGYFGVVRYNPSSPSPQVSEGECLMAYPMAMQGTLPFVSPLFEWQPVSFAERAGSFVPFRKVPFIDSGSSYPTNPINPLCSILPRGNNVPKNIFSYNVAAKGSIGGTYSKSDYYGIKQEIIPTELKDAYPGRKFLTPGMDNYFKYNYDPLLLCTEMLGLSPAVRNEISRFAPTAKNRIYFKEGIRKMGTRSFTYTVEGGGYLV